MCGSSIRTRVSAGRRSLVIKSGLMTEHKNSLQARWITTMAAIIALLASAGCAASPSTLSCSWPMQVRGTASAVQVGLVRCYLKAISQRDTKELGLLMAKVDPNGHITNADLVHSHDTRTGTATSTFVPNPSDPTFVKLMITYADGAVETVGLDNMIAYGKPSAWRMDIGSSWDQH